MLEVSDENNRRRMREGDCKIYARELEELLESEKSWNSQMCIEFNDLCYSVRCKEGTEKTILHNVTGRFEPKKITVIIGPSGAGKSTLMKIVSGHQLINIKGTIIVNGVERNRDAFRKQMCYVQQQFDLMPYLTTRETLYIAARLKLDVNETEQAICSVVNDIAENLGLSNCLDTLAHKLSGGERKRLSIGVEMISKPSVLLLDEPTSGLDSVASKQLIDMLHNMARANCTVVCAIHQPSSQMISLFDDIMVLNQGRCMYCGPKSEILNTYSIAGYTCPGFYNIAEFVLEVITEQRDGDLENLHKICRNEYENYRLLCKHKENELDLLTDSRKKCETNVTYGPISRTTQKKTMWQQQKILFLRSIINLKRHTILTKVRISMHIAVAMLFGGIFYNFGDNAEKVDSNLSYLFCTPVFLFMLNTGMAVLMFPVEATVFLQENLNNWYSLKAYYSVKILTDLLMQIICCTLFTLISYYMTGQPMEYDRFLGLWLIGLLITIVAQMLGVFLGTLFDAEAGLCVVAATLAPAILFGGFLSKIKEMPTFLQPISFLSHIRFAFEGIMQMVYLDRPNLTCSEIYCYMRSPRKILSTMDMPTVPFYVIVMILGSWILCLHVATYTMLRWKIYNSRK